MVVNNKIEYNMMSNVENIKSLKEYLINKGRKHNHYKLYSKMDRIIDIRDNQRLYLGTGKKWNDKTDRENFNSDSYNTINFGKCFSFSQEENVAMWMLYGGIEKHSAMIDFTNKGMQNILSVNSIELGKFENGIFVSNTKLNREFFRIYVIDIVYYKKFDNSYYIKRSDETINNLKIDYFDDLIGCKKAYPWQYENECRLIVEIEKNLVPNGCDIVKIDLENMELGKSFNRIYRGPNYSLSNHFDTLPSNLDNSIDWSLCDLNCKCVNEEKQ